ncbi:amino acid ABC transporter substrate-binding protein [Actinosynnema mirum]|uniref:Extracellular ligand-binding receptor n=1 Tax=Actinosynnema mirum (strain ATCC 29888 / DSM 43827 / JCM 3225 / NBRC 14064 / NCIMB 13271 / NRRL B-12336 / IMRU 3971 / 101) TaxID=446462 RepID=C6WQD7_ACTMD|nr:amino acid ABC transporter substrate-binding protein [Actinosynnema mirum]ACU36791.1 Extracellular ligand-binding receptor [Actinosynnema mirum DSM 43827]
MAIPDSRLWWHKPELVGAAVVGALLLAVGVVVGVRAMPVDCGGRDELVLVDGQCVGVADADSDFDFGRPEYADVVRTIREQNAAVADGPNVVSVVVLLAMTPRDESFELAEQVRHDALGAARAQLVHNWSGSTPKLKLLLANAGDRFEHWAEVVGRIDARQAAPDRVVAVTGLGQSLETVYRAARALSEKKIPMVSSTLTSDDFNDVKGLLRPAPSNRAQGRAAAEWAFDRIGKSAPTAVLLVDKNEGDKYPESLADGFRRGIEELGGKVGEPVLRYNSSADIGTTIAVLESSLGAICSQEVDVVYFAGRGRDLALLVERLATRSCPRKEPLVLTGDDSLTESQLGEARFQSALRNSKVQIFATSLAVTGPGELREIAADLNNQYLVEQFIGGVGGVPELDRAALGDDGTVLSHDAVWTVMQAASRAQKQKAVSASVVGGMFDALRNDGGFPGVSGPLSYGEDGSATGKVVPLLEIVPDGEPRLVFPKLPAS